MPGFPTADFNRFWRGETVSAFGTYVTLLALQTLVVLTLDGTAQDVGWLSSARWLPYLLLGLVVGALVDRRRRRPVMITTDFLRAALLASIPAAWAMDVLSMPLLLAVVVCYGAASLVNDAASQSFMPRLVPRASLQRAHARIDGADAVAQTAGPALAGVLVKVVGAPLAVLVDAATYVFSAAAVLTLRIQEPAPSPAATPACAARSGRRPLGLPGLRPRRPGQRHPRLVRGERRARRRPRALRAAHAGPQSTAVRPCHGARRGRRIRGCDDDHGRWPPARHRRRGHHRPSRDDDRRRTRGTGRSRHRRPVRGGRPRARTGLPWLRDRLQQLSR